MLSSHLRSRRDSRLAIVLAGAFVLAACSGCGSDGPSPDASSPGVITEAQYRGAIEAEAACVQQAGYQTTPIAKGSDGLTLQFGLSVPTGIEIGTTAGDSWNAAAQAAQDQCYQRYAHDVEHAYIAAHVPSGSQRDADFDAMLSCLADAGVTGLSRDDTETQIVNAVVTQLPNDWSRGFACMDAYQYIFPDRAPK